MSIPTDIDRRVASHVAQSMPVGTRRFRARNDARDQAARLAADQRVQQWARSEIRWLRRNVPTIEEGTLAAAWLAWTSAQARPLVNHPRRERARLAEAKRAIDRFIEIARGLDGIYELLL